jgi:hypothetical protein
MKALKNILLLFFICFIVNAVRGQDLRKRESHIVAETENAFIIAANHNIPIDSLKKWNNLNNNYNVVPGQQLILFHEKSEPEISIGRESRKPAVYYGTKKYLAIFSDDFNFQKRKASSLPAEVKSYYEYSGSKVRIIFLLIAYFLILLILLIALISINRISIERAKKKKENFGILYREYITGWLYYDKTRIDLNDLRNDLLDRDKREIFVENLLSLHTNFIGESAEMLADLYQQLDLKKYALIKASNRKWHYRAKAFREIAQMSISEGYPIIENHLNSKNSMLRIEARLAWIKLNPSNPFSYLDNPDVQLTLWGELNALDVIQQYKIIPPLFTRWFENQNPEVVIFAVKMTGFFKQLEAVNDLIRLLSSENEIIRKEVIISLGKLEMSDAIPYLNGIYPNETISNKIEIIIALSRISDEESIGLFKEALFENDFTLRLTAAKKIVLLGTMGYELLQSVLVSADETLTKIIIHAKDNRI